MQNRIEELENQRDGLAMDILMELKKLSSSSGF